jgi:mono/diheme cytochrome c family protein
MRTLVTVLVVLVVLAAGAIVVAYSGVVDVSAMRSDPGPVEWFLVTTRHHSIESRIEGIEVPPLDDPAAVAEGLEHYHEMCVTCHGAPGVEPSEIGKGLNPMPPDLTRKELDDEEAAEFFWVVANGIRMTGMPAFGATHTDQQIWHIVAFLRQLPELSPEDYAARVAAAGLGSGGGGHHHEGGEGEGETGEHHEHAEQAEGGAAGGTAEDTATDGGHEHHDGEPDHHDHPN